VTTRRSFLASVLAALPCAALLPSLALADDTPPAVRRSDPGIPRQMDLRKELHPHFADIEVRLHGKPVLHCVAYDLDTDSVALLCRGLDGRFIPELYMERDHAGVSVHWSRP
jgi:hypothetical protein